MISEIVNVYKIENINNGKIYIGQTKHDIQDRFKEHVRFALAGKRTRFSYAIVASGKNSFVASLIQVCDSRVSANVLEESLISLYDTTNTDKGYNTLKNTLWSGIGLTDYTHSPSTRLKISEARKGKPLSQEHKDSISNALKGRKLSPDHIRKVAEARTGVSLTPEHRLNLSKSHIGQKAWNKGIPRDEEVKLKISKANKGRPWSEARRAAYECRVTED